MIAYHQATPSSLPQIVKDGIKRTSRGAKGDDAAIAKTDAFLDSHRPDHLLHAGVSRDNNIYGYVTDGEKVIQITDGSPVSVASFVHDSKDSVLQLTVDAQRCYVSDLDKFNTVKAALESNKDSQTLQSLADDYWRTIQPLTTFQIGTIARPEILVTYDLPPDAITVIKQ